MIQRTTRHQFFLPSATHPSNRVAPRATGFGAPNKKPNKTGGKQDGVVDVVNVRDWGEIAEPGFDVGNLRAASPIRRVLDNSNELPFMSVVANFLSDAEGSGSIQPPEDVEQREIPPFELWAWREAHYEQYLVDVELVNTAMKRAVERCVSEALLGPVALGIYRGDAVARDIAQLRATRAAAVAAAEHEAGAGEAAAAAAAEHVRGRVVASRYAQAYAAILDAVDTPEKANAHVYMLSVTQLAMGNRIGSVCVEKLGLIGRNAASTYLDFDTDKPPLAVLTDAVNGLGDAISEDAKEAFFDELLVAASRCSLLVDSLARDD